MDTETLQNAINDILSNVPSEPFLCLPLSSILCATLKDNHGIDCHVVTGSLRFEDQIIFKHDFNISGLNNNNLQHWSGHSWVQINELIVDLSFFRTLYSPQFTKSCKDELVNHFGKGRGCIVANNEQMISNKLFYTPVETLTDSDVTAVIKGYLN